MATLAGITGYELPASAAEDSFDFSRVLAGTAGPAPVRGFNLHQTNRLALALRQGNRKFLDHADSLWGNDDAHPELAGFAIDHGAPGAPAQLYDLAADPGETSNLYMRAAGDRGTHEGGPREASGSRPQRSAGEGQRERGTKHPGSRRRSGAGRAMCRNRGGPVK